MAEEMGQLMQGGYPGLSRHPELQRIREAQNNLLIDPNFMNRLMGMGPQMMNAQGQGQQGPPQSHNFGSPGETHFRKMNPGEDQMDYMQQRNAWRMGGMSGGRQRQQPSMPAGGSAGGGK